MTASGPISSFHAAMFGLYLQTGNPMQTGSGGEMDSLALALEEYAGFEDASQVANLLRQGLRKAYLKGVSGNPALAMLARPTPIAWATPERNPFVLPSDHSSGDRGIGQFHVQLSDLRSHHDAERDAPSGYRRESQCGWRVHQSPEEGPQSRRYLRGGEAF